MRGEIQRCKCESRTLAVKLRGVNERDRWELTVSDAKERDKCEMQLRVPIQRFKWEVQMKAERER